MKYLLIIILLLGCENKTKSISTIIGTGGGGYASYLIAKDIGKGNKYVIPFVIAGSLLGGFIGSEIGENLIQKLLVLFWKIIKLTNQLRGITLIRI